MPAYRVKEKCYIGGRIHEEGEVVELAKALKVVPDHLVSISAAEAKKAAKAAKAADAAAEEGQPGATETPDFKGEAEEAGVESLG